MERMNRHSLHMEIMASLYFIMAIILHLLSQYCGYAGDLQYFKVIKNLPALRIFVCVSTSLYTKQFYE